MSYKPSICVCGGGSLGTVIAGVAASKGYEVNLLTGHPSSWNKVIEITDPDGQIFEGSLTRISDKPEEVIPGSDIIIFCLPGTVIYDELVRIRPYISDGALVGSVFSSTGFFIMALDLLGEQSRLFGFQRVPFICRIKKYGHSANLLGYKKSLNVAYWDVEDTTITTEWLADIFQTPVHVLNHPLEATLTNSNPILHPARLFTLFHNFEETTPFVNPPLFYEDWDDCSSENLIACDNEFQSLTAVLGIGREVIPSLLDYYESTDAASLTAKIRSIEAFRGIYAPTIRIEGGYAPDYDNRYFSEDIPFGLMLIKYMAEINSIATPSIDRIIRWYERLSGKVFLEGDKVADNAFTGEIHSLNRAVIMRLISTLHG